MTTTKKPADIIRSSAAEYLTFITATGDGDVNAIYADENVWLTQKMMGVLYDVTTSTVNEHLKKLYRDGEIDESSTIRKFRIVPSGRSARSVSRGEPLQPFGNHSRRQQSRFPKSGSVQEMGERGH